ncbi:FCD domain-containing protein [Propionimicrobium sp. PCR01-08-3]|nr:FCD domain-containing protein [Propionimicrobium sp. PCR01-08-3]WIY84173.1 FCD domain-containing protein [Propionimicrobium sp. PCR01-08-3]
MVERLGREIVTSRYSSGTVLRMDELAGDFGVSRSVIREAISVLAGSGLVQSRKHRGTVVQERKMWNALAPDVISWHLDDPAQRDAQFRALVELRTAIEPPAAYLAALHIEPDQAKQLIQLATVMVNAGEAGRIDTFVDADLVFHSLVLQGSGNPLFASLEQILNEILAGKYRLGLMPIVPDPVASRRHLELAEAIASHDADSAGKACRFIVQQSADELEQGQAHG